MAPEHLVAASLAFGAAPDKPVQPGLKTGSVSFATRHSGHYWFLAGLWILLIWLDFGFLVSSIDWLTLLVVASGCLSIWCPTSSFALLGAYP